MPQRPDRPAQKGRQSWKHAAAARPGQSPRTESKHIGRWVLTFLLLALIGIFVWVVWLPKWGQSHLVVMPIWSIDQLTLPLTPFAREDIDALRATPGVFLHDATEVAQDEASVDGYLTKIAGLTKNEREVLILYISAHGIADEGRAYLACSDFDRTTSGGKYDVNELLSKIASSTARLKLVILDTGRIDYDPRLGIVGNEFAARVADSVKKLKSHDLWVMLAAGGSQVSAVSYADRRSVFGKAVAEALTGRANQRKHRGNDDAYVDLTEFVQYVTRECRGWFGDPLLDYQTPILLKAGQGLEANVSKLKSDDYRLLFLSKKQRKELDAPPEKPAEEKKATAAAWQQGLRIPAALGLIQAQPATTTENTPDPAKEKPAAAAPQDKKGDEAAAKKAEEPAATAAKDAGEKPPATAAPAAAEPKAAEGAPKSATSPPAAKASPTKEPTAKKDDPQANMHARLRSELQRIWGLRDKLRAREANGMSPVDFAPHLWREAEAWIVYYETRLRSGRSMKDPADDPTHDGALLLRDMQTLAGNLDRLVTAMTNMVAADGVDEKSVGFRLIEAWNNRYLAKYKVEDDKFAREASAVEVEARQAVRQLHDLLYHSVYYVRWFGHANTTLPDFKGAGKSIASYLEHLGKRRSQLQQLERDKLPPGEHARLSEFIDGVQQAAAQQQQLDNILAKVESDALAKKQEPIGQRRIEELLATPILSGARRLDLLDAIQKLSPTGVSTTGQESSGTPAGGGTEGSARDGKSGSGGNDASSAPGQVSRGTQFNWSRVHECLILEERLIRLTDETTANTLDRDIREADKQSRQSVEGEAFSEPFWDAYHHATQTLKTYYTRIPREADNPVTLQLVDPRDARLVDAGQYPLARFRIVLESAAELQLDPVAQVLRLNDQFEAKLEITLISNKPNLIDSRVVMNNADGILSFEQLPEVQDLPIERGFYRKKFYWRVTARPDTVRNGKAATMVRMAAKYGSSEATASVEVNLPQPNRVDVFLTRVAVPAEFGGQSSTIGLQLFPNRSTKFICSIANQYDQPKTVDVLLYAIEPRPLVRAPIGKLDEAIRGSVYDEGSRVFLDAKLIAKSSKPIDLPAATPGRAAPARVPVQFVSPQAAPPPPPPAEGKPTTTPAAPPSIPIHGLAIQVVDVKQPGKDPPKWIEISPLSPNEYLTAEIGYDQRLQQIVATFTPKVKDDRGRPKLPSGKPIQFKWDPAGANLPVQGKQKLTAVLDAAAEMQTAILSADAPADNQDRDVRISVDGYPRAFLYRVSCRKAPNEPDFLRGENLARERTEIRIESITVPLQPYVYHYPPHVRLPPPEPEKKGDNQPPPPEHFNIFNHQPALFRAPAETLIVNLEADAPLDAFTNPTDGIRVRLRANNESRVLRTTRDMQAFYVGCDPAGVLELETKVADLSIPLQIGALQNVRTNVDAEIKFRSVERVSQVAVQLDGVRPTIQNIDFPTTVPKDGKAMVTFVVDDFTGVKRVVWGLSKNGAEVLVDATAVSRDVTARLNENRAHTFSVEIDLKDVPPGEQLFVAKVLDPVGHESELMSRKFLIVEAAKPVPTKGEIRGRLVYGKSPVLGALFELTVEGGAIGTKSVKLDSEGGFVIPNLDPGEYKLKPKGSVSGKMVKDKEFKASPTDPKKREEIPFDVSG